MPDKESLIERVKELTGWSVNPSRVKIITDTSEWMNIIRGDIIHLEGRNYVVKGNMSETRFGINEQPKYWVFHAIDLENASEKIIKTVFHEEFYAHISIFKIRCYRSPDKEGEVLDLGRGDPRFMQGITCRDDKNNNVRVIDYIKGVNYFNYIPAIKKPHEQFFYEDLPLILHKLVDTIAAIDLLHSHNLCHGDIRNDHIIIDTETGQYKWIDFDLKQDVRDFDLWSLGNILSYTIGKGIITFDSILKSPAYSAETKNSLKHEDSSAFYTYRIMNLKKVFGYIPDKMVNILLHFTIKPIGYYGSVKNLLEDFRSITDIRLIK